MKAGAFDYVRAESVDDALGLLARNGAAAKLLAGGQSLLPALNLRLSAPGILIDISRIAALQQIEVTSEGGLRIGALVRHAQLLHAPLVAQHAPLLARAIAHVAHPAIRSRGTLGGSLAHADPAAELPACVLALQARMVVRGPSGTHSIAAEAFFTGLFETALAADEILVAVEFPPRGPNAIEGFQELARRSGDYAIVGLAAAGYRRSGAISDLRLGFFSVGARATLATQAAACLVGRVTSDAVEAAKVALAEDLEPHDDLQASAATRMHLARTLLGRVMADMVGPI